MLNHCLYPKKLKRIERCEFDNLIYIRTCLHIVEQCTATSFFLGFFHSWFILIQYTNAAYSYLVTIMGLVIPWSFTLALVDGYSVLVKCPIRQPGILLIIVVGDWVCII
jgi:hypothetical protein